MGTLKEDIKEQSRWIVKAFEADGFKLDYSIDSFIEIDKFVDKNMKNGRPKAGGRLAVNLGATLFAIASYIGETIISNVPDSIWITDDEDAEGEINITVKLPNSTLIFPAQKLMGRFKNGAEDSIYVYGHVITQEFTKKPFNQHYWESTKAKPWWKFW